MRSKTFDLKSWMITGWLTFPVASQRREIVVPRCAVSPPLGERTRIVTGSVVLGVGEAVGIGVAVAVAVAVGDGEGVTLAVGDGDAVGLGLAVGDTDGLGDGEGEGEGVVGS